MNIRIRDFIVLAMAGTIAGCAATSQTGDSSVDSKDAVASIAESSPKQNMADVTSDFSRSKLIAADFVATIAQIPATDPTTTTLYAAEPKSRFGELLLGSLQQAGFDLRVGSDSADYMLAYNAVRDQQLSADGNPVYTFIIAAGEVKLKRSYEVDQYGVKPASGMFVRGASVNNLVSDDSKFSIRRPKPELEKELDSPVVKPVPVPAPIEPKPQPKVNPAPTIAELDQNNAAERYLQKDAEWQYEKSNKVLTPEEKLELELARARELEDTVAALAPARDLANSEDFINSDAYAEIPNMFETGQSRYQDILKDYEVVDTKELVFPDDSLLLGRDNKNAIRQFATSFNAETDVMSVIGCSHGSTKLENGNGYLANGRAFRVKEEFLSVGLSPKQVLEEGCWAEVAHPELPARGVLVQHKRIVE